MAHIYSRQNPNDGNDEFVVDDGGGSFWWTKKGEIIRWAIFFGIFFLLVAYMVIGYWHARRRMKKGLPPLGYHRWLLNRRRRRAMHDLNYQNPSTYYSFYPQSQQYGLANMPPPMYGSEPMPPTYQPPAGGTKVDPSQRGSEPTRRPADAGEAAPSYDAPLGPPPAMQANHTGASTISSNPYRL